MTARVAHLLPRAPGMMDGVADYALELARGLRDLYAIESVFLPHESTDGSHAGSFSIVPLRHPAAAFACAKDCDALVLHYVNYGFQKRGVPLSFLSLVKSLHQQCGGALLVIFHELFATGPPWRSEFWLHPLQRRIARELARIADARVVSCESMQRQLETLADDLSTVVQPVTSTWGEPELDQAQFNTRDPHCWVVCGGTALLERSFVSLLKSAAALPSDIAPRKVYLLGGSDNPRIRDLLNSEPAFAAEYFPNIAPAAAAPLFRAAAFAWLDYFTSRNVPADVLLKSSTFIGLSAHAVPCIVPAKRGAISVNGDAYPAAFTSSEIPPPRELADAASRGYAWYHRHAAHAVLARTVAEQLQLG
ncbi:MAG: hypothetical protein JO354_01945 [Verrucomicrobia bacterium]|nr:hypothetical protein [Verrucomicrobiota bacterium]